MKYLILFVVVIVILFPKKTNNQKIDLAQQEWEQFCQVYMKYVKRYPSVLDPGECI
tara:strand:- start:678 stop:845 length:168 start_codon:yes stop_codon:yes gene_type:complete